MEVRILGADSPDPLLTHKDGRVLVVQEIARQGRKLRKDLSFFDILRKQC